MTIYQAIAAANAERDFPTARDLADGLDRDPDAVSIELCHLRKIGRVLSLPSTSTHPRTMGRPVLRWMTLA